jgi:hypothetical protein
VPREEARRGGGRGVLVRIIIVEEEGLAGLVVLAG